MSTFAPHSIDSITALAVVFAALAAFWSTPRPTLQPATLRNVSRRDRRCFVIALSLAPMHLATAATNAGASSTLRTLINDALGTRAPQAAEYGDAARIKPWHRLRSVILLLALLVLLGIATAAGIGIIIFLAGFLLEQAIK